MDTLIYGKCQNTSVRNRTSFSTNSVNTRNHSKCHRIRNETSTDLPGDASWSISCKGNQITQSQNGKFVTSHEQRLTKYSLCEYFSLFLCVQSAAEVSRVCRYSNQLGTYSDSVTFHGDYKKLQIYKNNDYKLSTIVDDRSICFNGTERTLPEAICQASSYRRRSTVRLVKYLHFPTYVQRLDSLKLANMTIYRKMYIRIYRVRHRMQRQSR